MKLSPKHGLRFFLLFLLFALSVPEAGELPPLSAVSPLWIGGLRPEGLEFDLSGVPGWSFSLGLAYGNSFSMSSAVLDTHRSMDGTGRSLSREAFEAAAASNTAIHAVDIESLRVDLEVLYNSPSGFFGGARIPAWSIGGTSLDGWPEMVHSWIGVSNAGREDFPEGRSFFGLSDGGESLIIDQSAGLRPLSMDLWGGRRWELDHHNRLRAWLSASLPLVDLSDWGSRDFSWGLRWMAVHDFQGAELSAGLGWSSQGGRLPAGAAAADSFHVWMGLSVDLGKGFEAGFLARSDNSLYRRESPDRPGRDSGEFSVGLSCPLSAEMRLKLALGEDFPGMGLPPDFSIQTALVWRLQEKN